MSDVLFSTNQNGLATITLNRPKALNALNHNMLQSIQQTLKEWEHDDQIQVIILNGAGEKGFCAGGDIKALYQAKESHEAVQTAEAFFSTEYETDHIVHNYKKPMVAILDGIVMGGGVGLTYGASHRIVTETTKWAMPEMNIGFFPDVGAAYFLNHAPGKTGRYLALTASVIKAEDILYIKAADIFCPSNQLKNLLTSIENIDWKNTPVQATLSDILNKYQQNAPQTGHIELSQPKIDKHFSHQTVEDIIDSLATDSDAFATKTKETISTKSPISLKVALKQLIDGERKSLNECLNMELTMAKNFMRHADFFEGVRSVLIDKDQNPQYQYKTLADVSDTLVESFFKEPS